MDNDKEIMKTELSILLPSFENECFELVRKLHRQCESVENLIYEIIVADDGSIDSSFIPTNRQINDLTGCRFIERGFNAGRAAIRNFLAHEAKGEWRLFLDSDIDIEDGFITKYLYYITYSTTPRALDGGVKVPDIPGLKKSNLRYIYEKSAEASHSAIKRSLHPYQHFHTANFIFHSSLLSSVAFDERIKRYGHEDILMGKSLQLANFPIQHVDVPVLLPHYETNETFVCKTEDALHTLFEFRKDLRGYSTLLQLAERLKNFHLAWLLRIWHKKVGRQERKNLLSDHPSLLVFKLYKLGFYLTLKEKSTF